MIPGKEVMAHVKAEALKRKVIGHQDTSGELRLSRNLGAT